MQTPMQTNSNFLNRLRLRLHFRLRWQVQLKCKRKRRRYVGNQKCKRKRRRYVGAFICIGRVEPESIQWTVEIGPEFH